MVGPWTVQDFISIQFVAVILIRDLESQAFLMHHELGTMAKEQLFISKVKDIYRLNGIRGHLDGTKRQSCQKVVQRLGQIFSRG